MREAGHVTFNQSVDRFANLAKLSRRILQIGSTEAQINAALRGFVRYFRQVSDQQVELREDADHWYWVITRCAICWHASADVPICDYAVGTLEGALQWGFPQVDLHIEETSCMAKGDAQCIIAITKPA